MNTKIKSFEEYFTECRPITIGKILVTTNGCFDLLHYGHIALLQQAKAMGDYLVVGINSDASVACLKGDGRPRNSERIRAKQVAALECVDWVIIFEEDTPGEFITWTVPNIHVKGGDYKVMDLYESQQLLEQGAKIEIIPYINPHSNISAEVKTFK